MDNDLYRSLQTQRGVSSFWAKKHATEAGKNWDKFYTRNTTKFYKHRNWTSAEETDGFSCLTKDSKVRTVLVEAGCGVGDAAFPLIQANPSLFVHAFDFSSAAITLLKASNEYDDSRIHAFVWDFCSVEVRSIAEAERGQLSHGDADFVTLIFVLSAVPPDRQVRGLCNLFKVLKPGGRLLFRDYAIGDMAQKRFASKNKIDENYFVRQDNTLSYFFDEERLSGIAKEVGFHESYIRRVNRVITNRKKNLDMHRSFLQAEFIKPPLSA